MFSADQVHVVCRLDRIDVEMSRRASAAECAEGSSDTGQKEVRHCAVHVYAEQRGIDRNIRGPTVVPPPIDGEVKRIERSWAKRVVIADRDRLRPLVVA